MSTPSESLTPKRFFIYGDDRNIQLVHVTTCEATNRDFLNRKIRPLSSRLTKCCKLLTVCRGSFRCGIIHPGFTDTPMAQALGEEFLGKYVLTFTQLRRLIRTDEIADAICFMVSNSAVSGELWCDAGWHPPA